MAATPWVPVDRAATPTGSELILYQRDGDFQIRLDGLELMSSRAHASEEALASWACAELDGLPAPRVLIGGLGLGYTLRAALDSLPADASVDVVEVLPAVVAWNRTFLRDLLDNPLEDRRVTVRVGHIGALASATEQTFHAILLDVDNGPSTPSLPSNRALYNTAGLASLRRTLRPRGLLALWAPQAEDELHRNLRRAGFAVRSLEVAARPGARILHTIYLAVPRPDRERD